MHIDRQPLGDIAGVIKILVAANPEINIIYLHTTDKGEYRFSTKETKEFLEVDTLYNMQLLDDISCMVVENLNNNEVSGLTLKEKV